MLHTFANRRWINSRGPLLVLPRSLLGKWSGIEVPRNRVVQAAFRWAGPSSPATDYDRACDIAGYLGILKVGVGQALVVNDKPMSTTWRPLPRLGGGVLIRRQYAENEASAEYHLRRLFTAVYRRWRRRFLVASSPLVLFAAADPGAAVGDECLTMRLRPGWYQVETGQYQPDESTSFVLHRLLPK